MDLSQLDTSSKSETGAPVELRHPGSNVKLGIRIYVCGVDSKTYRDFIRRQQNRRMEEAKRNRGKVTMTAEELEDDALDLLVACTKGWDADVVEGEEKKTVGAIPFEGELLPCTPENVRRIYSHPGFAWLREQIDAEMGDRANFLPK